MFSGIWDFLLNINWSSVCRYAVSDAILVWVAVTGVFFILLPVILWQTHRKNLGVFLGIIYAGLIICGYFPIMGSGFSDYEKGDTTLPGGYILSEGSLEDNSPGLVEQDNASIGYRLGGIKWPWQEIQPGDTVILPIRYHYLFVGWAGNTHPVVSTYGDYIYTDGSNVDCCACARSDSIHTVQTHTIGTSSEQWNAVLLYVIIPVFVYTLYWTLIRASYWNKLKKY